MIKNYKDFKISDVILNEETIFTFDIETTSVILLDDKITHAINYSKLCEEDKKRCIKYAFMYVWQLGINEQVYYGRTWIELEEFLKTIHIRFKGKKHFYVHNLGFEFEFLRNILKFTKVFARTPHHPITAEVKLYNIIFHDTYIMTNTALVNLPKLYNLPVKKLIGDLDYNQIRTKDTVLSNKELCYCENDCLVLYYYIESMIKRYDELKNIPRTLTGQVRRVVKDKFRENEHLKYRISNMINDESYIYTRLCQAFMGGYVHSNYMYTGNIYKNVASFDITSSYPTAMILFKYPMTKFKKSKDSLEDIIKNKDRYAYIVTYILKDVQIKGYNTFISSSKCRHIKNGLYDNGRIISCDSLEITTTEVDMLFYLKAYSCKIEILEVLRATKNYLPRELIECLLDMYQTKTIYKGDLNHELEYSIAKSNFNSVYGMSVTQEVSDDIIFNSEIGWITNELSGAEITKKLKEIKKKGFMNFAWGVYVTSYSRNNLCENILKYDNYLIYSDTDSMKLKEGYDPKFIEEYNDTVMKRLERVARLRNLDFNKMVPIDKKGIKRPLGIFTFEDVYDEFVTLGSKKYAVKKDGEISITVAGVPKKASKSLKDLKDFKPNLKFEHKDTNKLQVVYIENNEQEFEIKDLQDHITKISDKFGVCMLPCDYILDVSLEYAKLLNGGRRCIKI